MSRIPSPALLLALFTLASPIFAPAATMQTTEVAITVPAETTLAVPGIRSTQQVWIETINLARTSIDLEQFYVTSAPGQALEPVLAALRAAALRGVHVRLIVDSKFYKTYPDNPNELSKLQNFEVRVIDLASTGGVQHAKFFVVDGALSFVGSANFDYLALSHIHEVGVRVLDPQIASGLTAIFNKDWEASAALSFEQPQQQKFAARLSPRTSSARLVASPKSINPPGIPESLPAMIQLLDSAKSSIRIQMYQYTTYAYGTETPWTDLDQAIRRAAARGVKVQFLVDAVSMKKGGKDLMALAAIKNIEVRTVTIPEWSGGHIEYARLIHSKYFTVDNTNSWVGTENWSMGYFTGSRNVGLIFSESKIASQLNMIFDQLWKSRYVTAL